MSSTSWKKSAKPKTVNDFPSGLLLFNKPIGVTSFDCVRLAKRALQSARVGHCGTLDPAAEGLLLILVGTATRAQESFLDLEKEYRFMAQFGIKTTTGDREGTVTETNSDVRVTHDALEQVLQGFIGLTHQTPPMYSALKYKGKPYYHYARRGRVIPRVARPVTISSFELLDLHFPNWEGRLTCSRGTYVRTLVEDVAERAGTCASLMELTRTRIGPYRLDQALTWEEFRTCDAARLIDKLIPVNGEPVALRV